jgi:hypothetical protein
MSDESLSPALREQLLESLEEMAEMLRSIEVLADQRGHFDAWWALVKGMIAMRGRVQLDQIGSGFSDEMGDLCTQYEAFIATVLPPLQEP